MSQTTTKNIDGPNESCPHVRISEHSSTIQVPPSGLESKSVLGCAQKSLHRRPSNISVAPSVAPVVTSAVSNRLITIDVNDDLPSQFLPSASSTQRSHPLSLLDFTVPPPALPPSLAHPNAADTSYQEDPPARPASPFLQILAAFSALPSKPAPTAAARVEEIFELLNRDPPLDFQVVIDSDDPEATRKDDGRGLQRLIDDLARDAACNWQTKNAIVDTGITPPRDAALSELGSVAQPVVVSRVSLSSSPNSRSGHQNRDGGLNGLAPSVRQRTRFIAKVEVLSETGSETEQIATERMCSASENSDAPRVPHRLKRRRVARGQAVVTIMGTQSPKQDEPSVETPPVESSPTTTSHEEEVVISVGSEDDYPVDGDECWPPVGNAGGRYSESVLAITESTAGSLPTSIADVIAECSAVESPSGSVEERHATPPVQGVLTASSPTVTESTIVATPIRVHASLPTISLQNSSPLLGDSAITSPKPPMFMSATLTEEILTDKEPTPRQPDSPRAQVVLASTIEPTASRPDISTPPSSPYREQSLPQSGLLSESCHTGLLDVVAAVSREALKRAALGIESGAVSDSEQLRSHRSQEVFSAIEVCKPERSFPPLTEGTAEVPIFIDVDVEEDTDVQTEQDNILERSRLEGSRLDNLAVAGPVPAIEESTVPNQPSTEFSGGELMEDYPTHGKPAKLTSTLPADSEITAVDKAGTSASLADPTECRAGTIASSVIATVLAGEDEPMNDPERADCREKATDPPQCGDAASTPSLQLSDCHSPPRTAESVISPEVASAPRLDPFPPDPEDPSPGSSHAALPDIQISASSHPALDTPLILQPGNSVVDISKLSCNQQAKLDRLMDEPTELLSAQEDGAVGHNATRKLPRTEAAAAARQNVVTLSCRLPDASGGAGRTKDDPRETSQESMQSATRAEHGGIRSIEEMTDGDRGDDETEGLSTVGEYGGSVTRADRGDSSRALASELPQSVGVSETPLVITVPVQGDDCAVSLVSRCVGPPNDENASFMPTAGAASPMGNEQAKENPTITQPVLIDASPPPSPTMILSVLVVSESEPETDHAEQEPMATGEQPAKAAVVSEDQSTAEEQPERSSQVNEELMTLFEEPCHTDEPGLNEGERSEAVTFHGRVCQPEGPIVMEAEPADSKKGLPGSQSEVLSVMVTTPISAPPQPIDGTGEGDAIEDSDSGRPDGSHTSFEAATSKPVASPILTSANHLVDQNLPLRDITHQDEGARVQVQLPCSAEPIERKIRVSVPATTVHLTVEASDQGTEGACLAKVTTVAALGEVENSLELPADQGKQPVQTQEARDGLETVIPAEDESVVDSFRRNDRIPAKNIDRELGSHEVEPAVGNDYTQVTENSADTALQAGTRIEVAGEATLSTASETAVAVAVAVDEAVTTAGAVADPANESPAPVVTSETVLPAAGEEHQSDGCLVDEDAVAAGPRGGPTINEEQIIAANATTISENATEDSAGAVVAEMPPGLPVVISIMEADEPSPCPSPDDCPIAIVDGEMKKLDGTARNEEESLNGTTVEKDTFTEDDRHQQPMSDKYRSLSSAELEGSGEHQQPYVTKQLGVTGSRMADTQTSPVHSFDKLFKTARDFPHSESCKTSGNGTGAATSAASLSEDPKRHLAMDRTPSPLPINDALASPDSLGPFAPPRVVATDCVASDGDALFFQAEVARTPTPALPSSPEEWSASCTVRPSAGSSINRPTPTILAPEQEDRLLNEAFTSIPAGEKAAVAGATPRPLRSLSLATAAPRIFQTAATLNRSPANSPLDRDPSRLLASPMGEIKSSANPPCFSPTCYQKQPPESAPTATSSPQDSETESASKGVIPPSAHTISSVTGSDQTVVNQVNGTSSESLQLVPVNEFSDMPFDNEPYTQETSDGFRRGDWPTLRRYHGFVIPDDIIIPLPDLGGIPGDIVIALPDREVGSAEVTIPLTDAKHSVTGSCQGRSVKESGPKSRDAKALGMNSLLKMVELRRSSCPHVELPVGTPHKSPLGVEVVEQHQPFTPSFAEIELPRQAGDNVNPQTVASSSMNEPAKSRKKRRRPGAESPASSSRSGSPTKIRTNGSDIWAPRSERPSTSLPSLTTIIGFGDGQPIPRRRSTIELNPSTLAEVVALRLGASGEGSGAELPETKRPRKAPESGTVLAASDKRISGSPIRDQALPINLPMFDTASSLRQAIALTREMLHAGSSDIAPPPSPLKKASVSSNIQMPLASDAALDIPTPHQTHPVARRTNRSPPGSRARTPPDNSKLLTSTLEPTDPSPTIEVSSATSGSSSSGKSAAGASVVGKKISTRKRASKARNRAIPTTPRSAAPAQEIPTRLAVPRPSVQAAVLQAVTVSAASATEKLVTTNPASHRKSRSRRRSAEQNGGADTEGESRAIGRRRSHGVSKVAQRKNTSKAASEHSQSIRSSANSLAPVAAATELSKFSPSYSVVEIAAAQCASPAAIPIPSAVAGLQPQIDVSPSQPLAAASHRRSKSVVTCLSLLPSELAATPNPDEHATVYSPAPKNVTRHRHSIARTTRLSLPLSKSAATPTNIDRPIAFSSRAADDIAWLNRHHRIHSSAEELIVQLSSDGGESTCYARQPSQQTRFIRGRSVVDHDSSVAAPESSPSTGSHSLSQAAHVTRRQATITNPAIPVVGEMFKLRGRRSMGAPRRSIGGLTVISPSPVSGIPRTGLALTSTDSATRIQEPAPRPTTATIVPPKRRRMDESSFFSLAAGVPASMPAACSTGEADQSTVRVAPTPGDPLLPTMEAIKMLAGKNLPADLAELIRSWTDQYAWDTISARSSNASACPCRYCQLTFPCVLILLRHMVTSNQATVTVTASAPDSRPSPPTNHHPSSLNNAPVVAPPATTSLGSGGSQPSVPFATSSYGGIFQTSSKSQTGPVAGSTSQPSSCCVPTYPKSGRSAIDTVLHATAAAAAPSSSAGSNLAQRSRPIRGASTFPGRRGG